MTEPDANEISVKEKDEEKREVNEQADYPGQNEPLSEGHLGLESESANDVPTPRSVQLEDELLQDPNSKGAEDTLSTTEATAETERLSVQAETEVVQRGAEELSITHLASPEDSLPTASPRTVSAGSTSNETMADMGESADETTQENKEVYKQSEGFGQDQQIDQEHPELKRDSTPLSELQETSNVKETTGPGEEKTEVAQRRPSSETEAKVSQRDFKEQNIHATAPPEDSMVYTATPRTVFEEENPSAGTHPLNMRWSFGINSQLAVYNLHDEDQKVILYICAHTAVLHDFSLNSQRHLQGHCSSISCVCVSEDRRWIATADNGPESLIIIWDSFSGIPVRTIFDSHPEGGVVAIAMSSNAKYLATVGGGTVQRVSIWKWTSRNEKAVCTAELSPNYGPQKYIIFNPRDHKQLISNSPTQVIFYAWNYSSLEYSAPSLTDSTFKKVVGAFSQSVFYLDTSKALTGTSAGKLVVWDTVSSPSITSNSFLKPHNKRALKLMPVQEDGITVLTVFDRYFVTGDVKGHVKFYDHQLELAHWYGNFNLAGICSISFSKNPPIPASEKTKYPQDCTLKGQQFAISNFVISTCNATVLHVSTDGTQIKKLLQEPCEAVHAVACHPTQPLLAIGSYSGILKVWDYKERNHYASRIFEKGKRLHCLSYNPEGSLLGAGFTDGSVYILDSLTLEDERPEPFRYARGAITHISFSHDSQYLATADEECTVTVFKLIFKGCDRIWDYFGRLRSHYKPIQSIIFGIHLDSDEARLLTLGMDRMLVEYDLCNSTKGHLRIQSSDRVEQSATPKCLAWYPPVTKESFILTANDQFKLKLYNATTKMCRKTLLGPTYGSPVKKMEVISRRDNHDTSKGYLAYITDDKVGLQMLPLDGNPHKSSALICHPAGVSNLVSSCDGCYVFTSGGTDCTVLMWEANLHALEAAASLGGEDLMPFYGLLDGGRDGELFRELEDYFYYAQLRSQGIDTMETRQVSTRIPLKEAPFIMRALGFYPSEQEIEDMLNEVKFSEYVNSGKQVSDINLGEFIKLYTNHRPAFGISMNELQQVFKVLGIEDKNGEWAIDRGELLQLLQTQGEHMIEEELAEHLTTLLGINPEGGSFEMGSYDTTGAAALLEQEIPQAITTQMFAAEILGLPVYSSEMGNIEEHATDLAITTDKC